MRLQPHEREQVSISARSCLRLSLVSMSAFVLAEFLLFVREAGECE
jgi:hypothetical protein